MKSLPKKTPATPSTANSRVASGDCSASALSRMSRVPSASTVRPGRNFKVAGLGVVSVWMNIAVSWDHRRVQGQRVRSYSFYKGLIGSFQRPGQPYWYVVEQF